MEKIKKVVNVFFVILFFTSIAVAVTFVILNYNDITIPKLNYFFTNADEYLGNSFDTIQNIYLTVFTCFLGVYFTVLGIVLSNKNISFKDFYFFTVTKNFILNLIILIINFILFLIVFPLYDYSIIIEIVYICNIIQVVYFSIISISGMSSLQNYDDTLKILTRKIEKMIKTDTKELFPILDTFINNAFPDKSIVQIYEDILKTIKPDLYEKALDEVFLNNLSSIQLTDEQQYKTELDFIVKNIYHTISNSNIDYNLLEKEVTIFFETYKVMIRSINLKYSHLLAIRDPIYFTLLYQKNSASKELKKQYAEIIRKSKEILIITLYQNNYELFEQELKDFTNFVQFLNQYNTFTSILNIFYSNLIDCITHIMNLTRIEKIDINFLKLIESIYNHIKTITIYDIDNEFYTEELPSIEFKHVKYSRNFFIAESLIILYFKNESAFNEKYNTIQYYKESDNEYKEYIHFDLLKSALETINKDDYVLYEKYINELFSNGLKVVKNKLEKSIQLIKNENLEISKKKITKEQISEKLQNEEKILRERLKRLTNINNISSPLIFKINSNYCFSARQMINDTSIITIGMDYYNLYLPLLYKGYVNMRNLEVITINKLEDLHLYTKEKIIEILAPISMHSYIYQTRIPGIKYKQEGFTLDDIEYHFSYIQSNRELIVLQDDLCNNIAINSIDNHLEEKSQEENIDIYDINIAIPFTINFAFESNKKLRAFRLIQ